MLHLAKICGDTINEIKNTTRQIHICIGLSMKKSFFIPKICKELLLYLPLRNLFSKGLDLASNVIWNLVLPIKGYMLSTGAFKY